MELKENTIEKGSSSRTVLIVPFMELKAMNDVFNYFYSWVLIVPFMELKALSRSFYA